MYFHFYSITLTPEEGGGSVELVTNGRNIQVNEVNVYDYVRLYANYRLVKTHEKSLEVSFFFGFLFNSGNRISTNVKSFTHRLYDLVFSMCCQAVHWTF